MTGLKFLFYIIIQCSSGMLKPPSKNLLHFNAPKKDSLNGAFIGNLWDFPEQLHWRANVNSFDYKLKTFYEDFSFLNQSLMLLLGAIVGTMTSNTVERTIYNYLASRCFTLVINPWD